MPKTTAEGRRNRTARAYLAALDRLIAGKATHPDYAGRPVRITPAAVAKEARRSRNPLYTTHRALLAEIEEAARVEDRQVDPMARRDVSNIQIATPFTLAIRAGCHFPVRRHSERADKRGQGPRDPIIEVQEAVASGSAGWERAQRSGTGAPVDR